MARRLGLRTPTEVEGRTAFDLPDQAAALALHNQDEAVLRTGEAQLYKLEKRVGADGDQWDMVTRLPLKDRAEIIVGIIVIFRNVTDQQRAEAKIREAVVRRDEFLAMLSHELRNPLGAMVTVTALLKADGVSSEKARHFVGVLERQSRQMTHLLDDLLEASRVTRDKIDLKKVTVDLNTVVSDAAEAVRGQMDDQGVTLTTAIHPQPLLVHGDPARLQQIQVNLLSNATKYTPRGGHIQVRTGIEAGLAVIRVADDGAGIPADMLESIFDLFVQSRRTLDRAAGGLGVGLTLVRALVTMHGGTVNAYSPGEGKGSELVVRLPLMTAAQPSSGAPVALPVLPPPVPPAELADCLSPAQARAHARVVVVEDNADSREMLCELLQEAGFICRAAENGLAALALMEEEVPDIAILDVGLPEMDGFELAGHIRANSRLAEVCLIALTGYGQPSDRAISLRAGFDAHLVKPVRPDELIELLRKMRARPTSSKKPAGAALVH
jgi:two-component system CheB/CheR fusion protein